MIARTKRNWYENDRDKRVKRHQERLGKIEIRNKWNKINFGYGLYRTPKGEK